MTLMPVLKAFSARGARRRRRPVAERCGNDVARRIGWHVCETVGAVELQLMCEPLDLRKVAERDGRELQPTAVGATHLDVTEHSPDVDDLLAGSRRLEDFLDRAPFHVV